MKFGEHLKKAWIDPVWSKVISAIIIALLTSIFLFLKDIIFDLPIKSGINGIKKYLLAQSIVENYVLILVLALSFLLGIISLTPLFLRLISISSENASNLQGKTSSTSLNIVKEDPTIFLEERLAKAFPGLRDLHWFNDPAEAISRLEIFFSDPIIFIEPTSNYSMVNIEHSAFWWFRGYTSSAISVFKCFRRDKFKRGRKICLINNDELIIKRLAVYKSNVRQQSFLYVETAPDEPTGIYKMDDEYIKDRIEKRGYSTEEYAIWRKRKRKITIDDYCDQATVIKGKVHEIENAESRRRFLTPYNFFIAANNSSVNAQSLQPRIESFLRDMIYSNAKLEEFINVLNKAPRRGKDYI